MDRGRARPAGPSRIVQKRGVRSPVEKAVERSAEARSAEAKQKGEARRDEPL